MEKLALDFMMGESPLYNEIDNLFYCVDILKKQVIKINEQNEVSRIEFEEACSMLFFDNNNQLCGAFDSGLFEIHFDLKSRKTIVETNLPDGFRYNDGFVFSNGTLAVGSINMDHSIVNEYDGSLYLFDDLKQDLLFDLVGISNGIEQIDNDVYYIDSKRRQIDHFLFENNQLMFIDRLIKFNSTPDGMTRDINNKLYVCQYDLGAIDIVSIETKTIEKTINLDEFHITSCCFGGKDMNKLYVTTGSELGKGVLYIIDMPTSGYPSNRYLRTTK